MKKAPGPLREPGASHGTRDSDPNMTVPGPCSESQMRMKGRKFHGFHNKVKARLCFPPAAPMQQDRLPCGCGQHRPSRTGLRPIRPVRTAREPGTAQKTIRAAALGPPPPDTAPRPCAIHPASACLRCANTPIPALPPHRCRTAAAHAAALPKRARRQEQPLTRGALSAGRRWRPPPRPRWWPSRRPGAHGADRRRAPG